VGRVRAIGVWQCILWAEVTSRPGWTLSPVFQIRCVGCDLASFAVSHGTRLVLAFS
jgi:hypothetical protein